MEAERRQIVNWSSSKLNVNGLNINCYRSGEEASHRVGPPVILAHGITDNGRCWNPLAEVLMESYDVLSLDARGHGFSDRPERGYGSREHAEDLAGLIKALKLVGPALIGHSMGADNAAMLAHMNPDLPCCIVLEDPPWRSLAKQSTRQEAEERAEQWGEEIRLRQRHSHEEVVAEGREIHPDWSENEYGPWADAKLQVDVSVLEYLTSRTPWSVMVRSIRCPTLLVTGDPTKEAFVTRETAEEICRMNENFEWVRIEGAGHSIRRDSFEQYAGAVTEFLHRNVSA